MLIGETMTLSGVNKVCQQCTGVCKQWEQVKVIRCPMFKSRQSLKVDALQAQQYEKEAQS